MIVIRAVGIKGRVDLSSDTGVVVYRLKNAYQ